MNIINNLFKKNSFSQNFAIVFSGKFAGILFSFFLIPIITRLFSPEDYGHFTLFTAIVTNLSLIACFSYPQALALPKKEETFYNLVAGTLIISLLFTIVIFLVTIFIGDYLLSFLEVKSKVFLFMIPVGVMIYSLLYVVTNWNVRRKQFKLSTALETGGNLSIRLINISQGLLIQNNWRGNLLSKSSGLFLGDMFGKFVAVLINLSQTLLKERVEFSKAIKKNSIVSVLSQYKAYPFYFFPSIWVAKFSSQIPLFVIAHYFNNSNLGAFSLTTNLLSQPIQLFANSLSPVILGELAREDNIENTRQTIKKLINRLFFITIIPFVLLALLAEDVFPYIFSSDWSLAGEIVKYLSPLFLLQLITFPIMSIYQITKNEKRKLFMDLFSFTVNIAGLGIGVYYQSFILTISAIAIINSIIQLMHIYIVYKILNLNAIPVIIKILTISSIAFISLYWFKNLIW